MTSSDPFGPPSEILAVRDADPPIARVRYTDGALGWVITRHASVRAVLAEPRFSARAELRSSVFPNRTTPAPASPGMFIGMDPPGHTRYRRALIGQFTVRRMRQLRERIEQIAQNRLDLMAATGPPVDLVAAYARPIPASVICELLGVPHQMREQFSRDVAVASHQEATSDQVGQTLAQTSAYLRELVRQKRAQPTDDVLSGLVTNGGLTDEELTNIAFLLLGAGLDTTANMLGLGTFALLSNPEQIPTITDPSTVDNAVEELLRYLPVIPGTVRAALEDTELDGVPIHAGESLLLWLSAANRDPDRFADPDTLDLTRRTSGHLAFGHGIHQCLGQQLARVELRVGFPALFHRFPDLRLAIPAHDVPMRDDMVIYGVHELPVTWGPAPQ